MKIQDLIDELEKIPNKNRKIIYFDPNEWVYTPVEKLQILESLTGFDPTQFLVLSLE